MKYITPYRLFENVAKAKKILGELSIEPTDTKYLQLREMLKNNLGFLGIFTEMLFKEKKSIEDLTQLFNNLKDVKLDKPIDSFKNYEEIVSYLEVKNQEKHYKVLFNELLPEWKK